MGMGIDRELFSNEGRRDEAILCQCTAIDPDGSNPLQYSLHFIFEGCASALSDCFYGRGGGIRTPDPLLPKQMRYQTALRPDSSSLSHRPSQRAEKPVGACPEQRMEQAIEDPRK